eukprot:snap_masked-scaffold_14-processed-gene-11.3-mRNA-1 protein AED:1.00 eAED:1.00 QI:0/-1/0/0/-1/1/1/0/302
MPSKEIKEEKPSMDKTAYKAQLQALWDILIPQMEEPQGKHLRAAFVRLAFHDVASFRPNLEWPRCGGANGSIHLEEEYSKGANFPFAGLVMETLIPIKNNFPLLSWADVIQLAGEATLHLSGLSKVNLRYGRIDSNLVEPVDLIPEADLRKMPEGNAGAHLKNHFFRMGFNVQEIVALSGSHTLGRGFPDRTVDVRPEGEEAIPMTPNPHVFNNEYFNLTPETRTVWFDTDEALLHDEFKQWHSLYAKDEKRFRQDFAKVYKKMSELGAKFQWEDGIYLHEPGKGKKQNDDDDKSSCTESSK